MSFREEQQKQIIVLSTRKSHNWFEDNSTFDISEQKNPKPEQSHLAT